MPGIGALVLFLSFCSVLPPHASLAALDEKEEAGAVSPMPDGRVDAKPLQRFPDSVILLGETLPPDWLGTEIRSIRVYRREGDRFEPIRFQVDERTEEGDWIFPHGKKNNARRSNARLDPQDLILFMAKDAGAEPVDLSALPGSPDKALPVELEDPVDGGKGWVCLVSYPDPPPPLCPLPAHVTYDAEKEIICSDYARAEYLITEDGLHTSFYKHHSTPPGAGGSGENLVDRLKFRVQLRFFFNMIPLSLHEEMLGSDVVAYIQGPIRVLRRVEQFVKLPFGIRGVKTYADVEIYESFATVPLSLQLPRGFHRIVSSANLQFGTDYSPNVIGSFFLNSEISDPLIIDGRMSEAEKHFPRNQDRWRLFYGTNGILMTRMFYPPELLKMVKISQGYLDDLTAPTTVERFPGCIGYAYSEIQAENLRAGTYRIFLDFYFPPRFQPGDEAAYLQLRDHPLRIRIGDRETVNPQDLHAEVGKDF